MRYLHHIFSSAPCTSVWLDSTFLPHIGEVAKKAVEENHEGHAILNMAVIINLNIPHQDEEDIDDNNNQHVSLATIMNSLEKIRIDDGGGDNGGGGCCSYWTDDCVICLEKLCNKGQN
ncbi:hypothetical protein RIF29_26229 [Crotalaria pallida]|uniref:Uncharacterized protein n=1 Tax=Crotalaria pallida TaxID=3830 RepID=A0AAN9ESH0_CROPI